MSIASESGARCCDDAGKGEARGVIGHSHADLFIYLGATPTTGRPTSFVERS